MSQLELNIACEDYMVQRITMVFDISLRVIDMHSSFEFGFHCDLFVGFRLQSTKCMAVVDLWKKFQHSNVVQLREVFTTKGFGDQCKHTPAANVNAITQFYSKFSLVNFSALVIVYDYHPGSQTLLAKYFTPTSESNNYQDPFQGEARPFR